MMKLKMQSFLRIIFSITVLITAITIYSCGTDTILTQIFSNEVTAKQRLDSAIAQAQHTYGSSTKLALIMGRNVKTNGKTDISTFSAITSPDSIGAWLYIFRVPSDTSLRIFTPDPVPGASGCIELTTFFNPTTLLNLIADTSARNIVQGALDIIISSNIGITTGRDSLVDSDVSLGYANTSDPVIKFNSNFEPSASHLNGNVFFSSGSDKRINMFLIPAAGTLNLPNYVQDLTGFPLDVWVVNYKKKNTSNAEESLIMAAVVESDQILGIPHLSLTSKAINISKFVSR